MSRMIPMTVSRRASGHRPLLTLVGLGLLFLGGCTATEHSAEGAGTAAPADPHEWPQWGGPRGDFHVTPTALDIWPEEGPALLWSRSLGGGYSAVTRAGGVLYTVYRDGGQDVVAALDPADGSTSWEYRYDAGPLDGQTTDFGVGPNATPLVRGDAVYTLSFGGKLHALGRADGTPIWSRDLVEELGAAPLDFGFSASPIEHDGRIVVLVGGEQAGVVAFEPTTGDIVWQSAPSSVSYATPIVADVDGQQQLIYFTADEIVGLDASDGATLWRHPCENQYRNNATGPIWGADGRLWVATQLDGGTRVLKLTRGDDGGTAVEESWFNPKVSIHFWNSLRLGSHVYASIGGNASIMAGVDIASGEIVWRQRGFEQANFVHAGERSLLLDARGQLALVTLSPEGLEVLSETKVADAEFWTPPTLTGSTLYVRGGDTLYAYALPVAG